MREMKVEEIEALLAEARRASQKKTDDTLCFFEGDAAELRRRLRVIARLREPTLDDVRETIAAIDEERSAALLAHWARRDACYKQSEDNWLYRVENSARRSINVVARNADCARLIALNAGHVEYEANAKVFRYKDAAVEEMKSSGSAMGGAVRDGAPGVLVAVGRNVINERAGKIYTPISVVRTE